MRISGYAPDHVMQTTNDIFVNSEAIEMKIAGKLVDDTEQVSGKTKLLGVKRELTPPPPLTEVTEKKQTSNFRLFLRL